MCTRAGGGGGNGGGGGGVEGRDLICPPEASHTVSALTLTLSHLLSDITNYN